MIDSGGFIAFLKKYDYSFFVMALGIFLIGIINLYSATHASPTVSHLYKNQILWFILSLFVGVGISFVSTKTYYRNAYLIYFLCLLLVAGVLFFGHQGMGAKRWLLLGPFRLQPSEIMKVGLVLILARWFAKRHAESTLGFKELLIPALFAGVPALLIILGPDLGTGFVTLLVFFTIIFFKRLKWKTLGVIMILGALSGTLMYQFGLKEYQRNRIVAFLDPSADARGSGYNAIQSKIAIGSGQLFGKGLKNSSQASLQYLPENHTDFIFSVYNEEHGFFGAIFLIALFLILMYRFLWLAVSVNRLFDSIVIIGLLSIFFWHTAINMAMVMGLMPVVGLPLPFLSYGGSSLMTFSICCGIATSISNSRNFF